MEKTKKEKEKIFIWKRMISFFILSRGIFNIFHFSQTFLQHFYRSVFK